MRFHFSMVHCKSGCSRSHTKIEQYIANYFFKTLKLETDALCFKINMSRPRKKGLVSCEAEPNPKALRYFKVKAV